MDWNSFRFIDPEVPKEAVKFRVKQPPTLQKNDVLKAINFDDSWITILKD